MKTIIIQFFKVFFKTELKDFCIKHFPMQVTTATTHLIFVKKGKIREHRFYDENFKRIFHLELNKNNRIKLKSICKHKN